eukprot:SAG25_NODE_621_length_6407_cov_3.818643_3_plen_108_part_00
MADAAPVALSRRQVAVPVPGRAQRVVAAGSRARRVRGGRERLLVAAAALGVLGGRGIRTRAASAAARQAAAAAHSRGGHIGKTTSPSPPQTKTAPEAGRAPGHRTEM